MNKQTTPEKKMKISDLIYNHVASIYPAFATDRIGETLCLTYRSIQVEIAPSRKTKGVSFDCYVSIIDPTGDQIDGNHRKIRFGEDLDFGDQICDLVSLDTIGCAERACVDGSDSDFICAIGDALALALTM